MKKQLLSREDILEKMVEPYHDLLMCIIPLQKNNPQFAFGIKEGANKFLSNFFISHAYKTLVDTFGKERLKELFPKDSGQLIGRRLTDYYSEKACEMLINGETNKYDEKGNKIDWLVYEHMIPKETYQENEIAKAFKDDGEMSVPDILKILKKKWYIATIMRSEELSLLKKKDLDEDSYRNDKFARYKELIDQHQLITREQFFERLLRNR